MTESRACLWGSCVLHNNDNLGDNLVNFLCMVGGLSPFHYNVLSSDPLSGMRSCLFDSLGSHFSPLDHDYSLLLVQRCHGKQNLATLLSTLFHAQHMEECAHRTPHLMK